jgi:hypothetical protein
MSLILFFFIFFIIIYILNKRREGYGWSCSFTPNYDYYKEDWLLGSNEMAQALARDAIRSPESL